MKKNISKQIVLLIGLTGLLVIGSQVYRTLSNYEINKRRFINDVQVALDLSIEKYYADKARNNVFIISKSSGDSTISVSSVDSLPSLLKTKKIDSFLGMSNNVITNRVQQISVSTGDLESVDQLKDKRIDSILAVANSMPFTKLSMDSTIGDLLPVWNFNNLQKKVMISFTEDILTLGKLWSLVKEELGRKGFDIQFQLEHEDKDGNKQSVGNKEDHWKMATTAKSTYLKDREEINMYFENASLLILKKGLIDLVISLILIGTVFGALF
ncbi:MAG: hypothetical protein AAF789_01445, partial [Bacteroidota bacterium]